MRTLQLFLILIIMGCNNNKLGKSEPKNKDKLDNKSITALPKSSSKKELEVAKSNNNNITPPIKKIEDNSNKNNQGPSSSKQESGNNVDLANSSKPKVEQQNEEKLLTPFDALVRMVKKIRKKLKDEAEGFDSSKIKTNLPIDNFKSLYKLSDKTRQQPIYASLGYNIKLINKLGEILNLNHFMIIKERNYTYQDYELVGDLFNILFEGTSSVYDMVNGYLQDKHLNTINDKGSINEINLIKFFLDQITQERDYLISKLISSMSILFDKVHVSNSIHKEQTSLIIYNAYRQKISDIVENEEINQSFNYIKELENNISNLVREIVYRQK